MFLKNETNINNKIIELYHFESHLSKMIVHTVYEYGAFLIQQ